MNPTHTRRCFTAAFKAEVALAALTGRQSLAALAVRCQVSAAQISRWKGHLLEQAAQVFAEPAPPDVEPLYAAIGRLQMEIQLLKRTLPPGP
jgi:transposase-like protein